MTEGLQNPNLARLALAARKLDPILGQIAFVGGCVTGLLITDPAAAPVRPTLDVDAIVEVASYAEFSALEDQLRRLGFRESLAEGGPVCRWVQEGLILDLMPTDASILGFSNRWYGPALDHAQRLRIEGREVRMITAPYFLATKFDAFHGRGQNDYRLSHDLEDIVTVLEGRAEIVADARSTEPEVQQFLAAEFSSLLASWEFLEALPGYLLPDAASQQRVALVLERMRQLAEATP